MKNNRPVSALVNKRNAVREHRLLRRDEVHNQRRIGLSVDPSSKATEDFDQVEMTRLCESLRRSRASNIPIADLRTLKRLLLHPGGLPAFMKDRGALHGLIGELSGKRVIHQLEAAYVCANLGLGGEEYSYPVCKAAGSYLVQFLEGSNYYLREAAVWAIGNLAGTSIKCAAVLCSQGVVSHLTQLLPGPQKDLSLASAYALSHIIHVKTLFQSDELREVAQLSALLVSTEPEFCVLLYVLSCIPACEEIMLNERIVTRIFAILPNLDQSEEGFLKTCTALLRTVGNLVCGMGALEFISIQEAGQFLKALLVSPHIHLRKECAWVCANLICHENADVCSFAEVVGLRGSLEDLVTADPLFACV